MTYQEKARYIYTKFLSIVNDKDTAITCSKFMIDEIINDLNSDIPNSLTKLKIYEWKKIRTFL